MRRVLLSFVILGCVLGPAAWVQADDPPAGRAWPAQVEGYGLTVELARINAMTRARESVAEYLRQLKPPLLEWQPDESDLEKYILDGRGQAGQEVKLDDEKVKFQSWIVRLKPPNLREFTALNERALQARRDRLRHEVGDERITLASWILGGMLALLAGGWVVGRLRSKRRRSTPA